MAITLLEINENIGTRTVPCLVDDHIVAALYCNAMTGLARGFCRIIFKWIKISGENP